MTAIKPLQNSQSVTAATDKVKGVVIRSVCSDKTNLSTTLSTTFEANGISFHT